MTIRAKDIPFGPPEDEGPVIAERIFRERGDQRYSLELMPAGITIEVDRLRREHREMVGELTVSVNGSFPKARSVGGIISIADFNFSSAMARTTRAKLLAERSQAGSLDWYGFLEEFSLKVMDAERKGQPAIVLADEPDTPEAADTWEVDGFPILRDLPMVLFGSGSSGKSYFAMWLAGRLAARGIPVLYADWEFSIRDHRRRFGRLFQPMPPCLFYVRCDRPIKDEIERLTRLVRLHACQYIVCDSMVFALEGAAEGSEQAGIYFRALRQLRIGSLNLAHIAKGDAEEETPFGSVFFSNGARSVWYSHRAQQSPFGLLRMGLYHRKTNVGEILKPRGFQFKFSG